MLGAKPAESRESPRCLLSDVGPARLNQQHLRLASYAVEFQQLVEELAEREPAHEDWKHIDALYGRISRFIAEHFREEEALMVQHRYPDYAAHKRLHDRFIEDMAKVQSQINNRKSQIAYSPPGLLLCGTLHSGQVPGSPVRLLTPGIRRSRGIVSGSSAAR